MYQLVRYRLMVLWLVHGAEFRNRHGTLQISILNRTRSLDDGRGGMLLAGRVKEKATTYWLLRARVEEGITYGQCCSAERLFLAQMRLFLTE